MREEYYKIFQKIIIENFSERGNCLMCEIISGSMRYLINPKSKVRIVKCNIKDIKIFDIISYKNEPYPIVHRVIWKFKKDGKLFFITKGDSCILPDKMIVGEKNFLGKVVRIQDKEKEINLESFWGRFISIFYFLVSYIVSIFTSISLKNIKNFFVEKTNKIVLNEELSFKKENLKIWEKISLKIFKVLNKIEDEVKFLEINFFGGYSEVGLELIRSGKDVKLVDIRDFEKEDFSKYKNGCFIVNFFNFCINNKIFNFLKLLLEKNEIKKFLFILDKKSKNLLLDLINKSNLLLNLKRRIYFGEYYILLLENKI